MGCKINANLMSYVNDHSRNFLSGGKANALDMWNMRLFIIIYNLCMYVDDFTLLGLHSYVWIDWEPNVAPAKWNLVGGVNTPTIQSMVWTKHQLAIRINSIEVLLYLNDLKRWHYTSSYSQLPEALLVSSKSMSQNTFHETSLEPNKDAPILNISALQPY